MIKHLVEVDNSLQLRRLLRKRMLIIRVSALGEALTGKLPLFAHRAYFPPWLKKIKCVFKATAQVVPAAVSYASATSGNLRGMTASGRPRRRSSGSPPSSPRGSRWGFPPGLPPRMAVPGAWLGRGGARPLVDATPGVPGVSRRGMHRPETAPIPSA